MNRSPQIRTVMTAFPYSIPKHASLREAEAMMREHHIRHLPVKQDGELIGVLSDRDIESALHPDLEPAVADALTVQDAFVSESCIVDLHHPLDEVLKEMAERRIDSVLVVKEGRLAGIFTATDACRLFADFLSSSFPPNDGVA